MRKEACVFVKGQGRGAVENISIAGSLAYRGQGRACSLRALGESMWGLGIAWKSTGSETRAGSLFIAGVQLGGVGRQAVRGSLTLTNSDQYCNSILNTSDVPSMWQGSVLFRYLQPFLLILQISKLSWELGILKCALNFATGCCLPSG